jgi:hypothetical protein
MERADQRARPLRLASLVGALALAAACAEPCPAPVEAAPAAIPAGSYETPLVMALPFRAADLDADLYTLTRGHSGYACGPTDSPASRRCALDIRALRWDPESDNYTRSASAAHVSSPALVDDVMWGLAVASRRRQPL